MFWLFPFRFTKYFLRGNIISRSSHINLLEHIETRNDKEDPGSPGSTPHQPAQSEDDGPLVLLQGAHYPDVTSNLRGSPGQLSPQTIMRAVTWLLWEVANILWGRLRTILVPRHTLTRDFVKWRSQTLYNGLVSGEMSQSSEIIVEISPLNFIVLSQQ